MEKDRIFRKLTRVVLTAALAIVAPLLCETCVNVSQTTVYAAEGVYSTTAQVTAYLKDVLSDKGNTEATFVTDFEMSSSQVQRALNEASIANGRVLTGSSKYVRASSGGIYTYRLELLPSSFVDVVVLNSEKSAYAKALKALKKRSYSTVYYSENNMYYDTFVRVVEQHPEYNYGVMIWKATNGTCGYRLNEEVSAASVKKMMKKADQKAAKAVASIITDGMTAREKYRAIHDYIVKNCAYDMNTYENSTYNDYDPANTAYTAYGCLIEKAAVCQGYAAAFNLMCSKAGLYAMAVSGQARGDSHAWNLVKVGSKYLYVDATWDDPVPDRGKEVSTTYFLLGADEIGKDHAWVKTKFATKYVKYSKYAF